MLYRYAAVTALSLVSVGSIAHAEQFVLVDVSYTHSTDTTRDSHFYPDLPADTPKNWVSPIDYSKGSVHLVLDVKTKPDGNAPTKLQVCFEATPSYACTVQSPTYTKPGRVEWDSPFSAFWYESTVDWSKGIKESPLILKDDKNGKPHGNPQYMPTDLNVQVTLVAPGSTFVPPPVAGAGGRGGAGGAIGGEGGRGGTGGASAGAGGTPSAGAGAGGSDGEAGEGGSASVAGSGGRPAGSAAGSGGSAGRASNPAAGSGAAGRAGAGAPGASGAPSGAAGTPGSGVAGAVGTMTGSQSMDSGGDSGCRAAGSSSSAPWAVGFALLYLGWRRRRA